MYSRAQKRLVNSQKYGVDLVRFTHAKNAAIHASTKRDDAIRYLSLHDNKVNLLAIRLTLENIHFTRILLNQMNHPCQFLVHTLFYWAYKKSYQS